LCENAGRNHDGKFRAESKCNLKDFCSLLKQQRALKAAFGSAISSKPSADDLFLALAAKRTHQDGDSFKVQVLFIVH